MKAGLEDVYSRDSHVSTAEIRKGGETRPVQHCSKCGIACHKANRCTGSKSSSYKQKFVNTDSLDPFCKVRDKDGDSDLRDLYKIILLKNILRVKIMTLRKLTPLRQLLINLLGLMIRTSVDSPAKRTISRNKNVAADDIAQEHPHLGSEGSRDGEF